VLGGRASGKGGWRCTGHGGGFAACEECVGKVDLRSTMDVLIWQQS
jgi:hypothetical protein